MLQLQRAHPLRVLLAEHFFHSLACLCDGFGAQQPATQVNVFTLILIKKFQNRGSSE
jgi:hypothetical protein